VNVILWTVQVVLAAAFVLAGVMKLTQPVENLATRLKWVPTLPVAGVRFIGVAELLGGIGLLLPAVSGIDVWLTPLAAVGLAVVMLLAAIFHVARREISQLPPSVVLGALAAFAAYGRVALAPL
jgi:putative oxidoreductase